MPWKVFFLEPVAQVETSLRRFCSTHGDDTPCPSGYGYHNASVVAGRRDEPLRSKEDRYERSTSRVSHEDERWPAKCEHCDYHFQPTDSWQVNDDRLYSGCYDGQLYTLDTAPIGAMWDSWWMGRMWQGPDGISLVVKTPGGMWQVDGEASNCTRTSKVTAMEEGHEVTRYGPRSHYCWIRHGDPRTGNLHVDKNGDTCSAGAGSILQGTYHGFLHHGYLTDGC